MSDRDPRDRLEDLVRSGSRRLDLTGFRTFVLRGNVVDLAVGIVIGAAFSTLIKAVVDDFITPLVNIPLGRASQFSDRYWNIGGSHFKYGEFANALISLLLIAIVVYYFVVKPVNALMERYKTDTDQAAPTKICPECKSSVPFDATRCAFCTVEIPLAPAGSEHPHPA
jgi:large conductance mechanosensitive channel